ncbi:thiol-disulfide isomerase/thioredoxin [Roseimicrobium gellanilyticum]|uniref:Thiol-disulfide isomerase/thioredoxin n=1 Tax=Roseimicrobium gellanilyticum TaxID=748857 RepID=A0A366HR30_9BACT|nr:thioredoxin-like domain-containing protein [Roseimicrobium gellanilyticum]RBP46120.1 thiol-disulfide isomerase/thioredoxin [Roseimicrobium gellanilyticum]
MKTSHFTVAGLAFALVLAFAPALRAENTVYPAVKDSLVKSKGKNVETFDAAALKDAKYVAIYYSASWCGPCRAFTPDLVKWYKRNKSKNPHFELIFVSSDRSAKDMAEYMKADDMEWPALAFDKKKDSASSAVTKYSGRGIPCLVLIDETGKVLSDSYVDGNYVGPRKVLEDIEKTLKDNPAAGAAASGSSGSALDRFKSTSTSTTPAR